MNIRLSLGRTLSSLALKLKLPHSPHEFFWASANIAPGAVVPLIHDEGLHLCRWGITGFSPEPISTLPISDLDSFGHSYRRCTVPIDGFYECDPFGRARYFSGDFGSILFIAAIFTDSNSFAILAKPSTLAALSDYSPIVIRREDCARWESEQVLTDGEISLNFYYVSRTVLLSGHIGPECHQRTVDRKMHKILIESLKTPLHF
jgi:putative SOS response-associated peptidase YedK